MSNQNWSQSPLEVPTASQEGDFCVPEDILEIISPDEFHIREASIAASWDDEPRHVQTGASEYTVQHPAPTSSLRSTSSRQSQSHGGVRSYGLTLSNSPSLGVRGTPTSLPPVTGRSLSLKGFEGGEVTRSRGPRDSVSHHSPDEALYSDTLDEGVTTPCHGSYVPILAHQVTFTDVELPEAHEENCGKRRRQQAERINKSGPPPPAEACRPVSANPPPCELNAEMMIHACGVDSPSDVGSLPSFTSLKALNLENNMISHIAPLGQLESLMQLHVACNRIQRLPELSTGLFFQLQVLDVSFNQIPVSEVLSRESDWSRLPSLRKLDLSGNHLLQLPDAIGSFPSLQHLALEYNQLSGQSLQPLGGLRKLQVLGMANNLVDAIPADAFTAPAFHSLTVLDLSRNRIRKPETLQALQQLRNGTVVYIGDNPIARKMRLRLVQPTAIPGARPGTVDIPEDAREPVTTTVATEGPGDPRHGLETPNGQSSIVANAAGGPGVDPLSDSSTSSVFVKMMRYAPERPTLAKSLLDGILHVRKSISKDQRGTWKMDEAAGDRLLAVFDELNVDIGKWREMETVPEERESETASLAGAATDRHSDNLQQPSAAEIPSLAHEVETSAQQPWEAATEFPDLSDPTESVAARLGLDYKLLSHHTGLLGTDVNGAVARLRFMLANSRCTRNLGDTKAPAHQTLTTSAALKQRGKRHPDKPVLSVPTPPSKHEQQVETIQSALQGMQTKLSQVQKDIAEQLERHEYLVEDKLTERSLLSTPANDPSHSNVIRVEDEASQEQLIDRGDAGDCKMVPPSDDMPPDETSKPGSTCRGKATDNAMSTSSRNQEQRRQSGVMQAAVETEALNYM